MPDTHSYPMTPIAIIRNGYKEKFGIPRQPGLANSVTSKVELLPPYNTPDALRGLEGCSHIWLLFIFSASAEQGWRPLVRPPRLGGNKKIGVFASRSPFRPNPIGMSQVELINIHISGQDVALEVKGADLLDGTPILDIKPYLPYSDSQPDAHFDLAPAPERLNLPVIFSVNAQHAIEAYKQQSHTTDNLLDALKEILLCDPRPAYQKTDEHRQYALRFHGLDVKWRITESEIYVDDAVLV